MTSKPIPQARSSRSSSTSNSSSSSKRSCSSGSRASGARSSSSSNSSKLSLGFKSPVLGNNFRIPDLYSELQDVQLDDTLTYMPVYCHFIVPEIEPIVRPKTPPILKALRAELEELQLIKPTKTKAEQKSRSTPQDHNKRQSGKNRTIEKASSLGSINF